jgi:hypothetical protein
VNVTEPRQTFIRSNVEPEAKSVVVMVCRTEMPEGRSGDWEEEPLVEIYWE